MAEKHDMASWQMWHGAGLARSAEKMPPLSLFMSSQKKKVKGIDEAAIMQRLKSYQKARDGNSSKT